MKGWRCQFKIRCGVWIGLLLLGGSHVWAEKDPEKRFFFLLDEAVAVANSPDAQPSGSDEQKGQPASSTVDGPLPATDLYLDVSYLKFGFARDLLMDQFAIWQSPAQIRKRDLRWLLPFGLTTAALIPFDRQASEALRGRFEGGSIKFSMAGGPMSLATSATMFGIGHFARKPHLRETGLLGMRAVSSTWLTVKTLKWSTDRQRPTEDGVQQDGRFWGGGRSFPSGHSAETWALATVIAQQYPKKRWLRFASYAFAAGISFARVSGQKHFPSDVLVGALLGSLIGRHVVRNWRDKRRALLLELRSQNRIQP